MNVITDFNERRQEKKLLTERKMLKDLAIRKLKNMIDEWFNPFFKNASIKLQWKKSVSTRPLNLFCWERPTAGSDITENRWSRPIHVVYRKNKSLLTIYLTIFFIWQGNQMMILLWNPSI